MAFWHGFLACPQCKQQLEQHSDDYHCQRCDKSFARNNGVSYFLAPAETSHLLDNPDGQAMASGYRKPSSFVSSLRKVISSEYFPGKAWKAAKQRTLEQEGGCLIIGSGVSQYPNACHLDIDDFPGVEVVGDAHHLPFQDNAFQGVVCEVVLEHVPQAAQIIAEAYRVLKPGGSIFFVVPFLFPFHGHPSDYRRWSKQGLSADFSMFEHQEIGIHGGPCSSMVNLISEWLYVLSGQSFPKGYVPIKGLATALLFPIKFLDYFVNKFPEAHRLASTLYIYAHKPK